MPHVLPPKSLLLYRLLGLICLLSTAYGLMFIDNLLRLWPSVGLDYSTHTAAALAFVIYLTLLKPQLKFLWSISLIAYCVLMRYQQYHSIADMITTAAVFTLTLLLVYWLTNLIGALKVSTKRMIESFPAFRG